jgi:HK97 gp10 family phage protein
MASKTRVELIGDKELMEKIHKMGDLVRQANSKAARAGAEPIKEQANANAPGPHILALQSKINSTEDQAIVDIAPDKDHWYYQFLETGATAHEIKGNPLAFEGENGPVITKSVHHPGIAARPFLRPAMANNRDEVQKIAGEVFLAEINKVCDVD